MLVVIYYPPVRNRGLMVGYRRPIRLRAFRVARRDAGEYYDNSL